VLDEGAVGDPDLPFLEDRGHGHHDGEFLGVALEVVGHGEDGLVLVTDKHHLRGLIEQLGVGFGHIETAEGQRRRRRERDGEDRGHESRRELHTRLLSLGDVSVDCHW
jgi:hypothetical protein